MCYEYHLLGVEETLEPTERGGDAASRYSIELIAGV